MSRNGREIVGDVTGFVSESRVDEPDQVESRVFERRYLEGGIAWMGADEGGLDPRSSLPREVGGK